MKNMKRMAALCLALMLAGCRGAQPALPDSTPAQSEVPPGMAVAYGVVLDYTDGSGEGLHNFKEFIRVDGKNVLLKEWMESDAYAAWQAK